MIRFEDKELELFALTEGCIAVPVKLTENEILSYRVCKNTVEEWDKTHGNYFEPEAVKEMALRLRPIMKTKGFEPDDRMGEVIFSYIKTEEGSTGGTFLSCNDEIDDAVFDESLEKLEVDDDDEMDVLSVVVEDGKVVAFAAVNDLTDDGNPEITVETAPDYRGKGYAKECVRALCSHLLNKCGAKAIVYECRSNNIASAVVADKVGFTLKEKYIPFVFYKA